MSYAMCKETPDGVFKVSIESEGFDPGHDHEEVSGESLQQLAQLLEELAFAIRCAADPELRRSTEGVGHVPKA